MIYITLHALYPAALWFGLLIVVVLWGIVKFAIPVS